MRKKISAAGLFVTMLMCFSGNVNAQFLTETAATVSDGGFEIETRLDYWDYVSGYFSIIHGITERMDIGAAFTKEKGEKIDGIDIAIKFGLIPGFLSVYATGGFGESEYGMKAVVSKAFGPLLIDLNLGFGQNRYIVDNDEAMFLYGLCCTFNIKKFSAGAEIIGSKQDLNLWQAGVSYELLDFVSVDAGINGDFEEDISLSVTTGLTFEFSMPDRNR